MANWSSMGPEFSPTALAERDHLQSLAQMSQINNSNTLARHRQQEIDRNEAIRKAFQAPEPDTGFVGPPEDPVQQVFNSAEKLRRLGYPEKAAEVVESGAKAARDQAAEQASRSAGRLSALMKADDAFSAIAPFYANVRDQKSFDIANGLVSQMTGIPSPLMGQQYSPELVASLGQAQMKARDRALLPYQIDKLKAQTEATRNLQDYRNARLRIYEAQQKLREDKAAAQEKNGGTDAKPVGFPSREEVIQAATVIKKQFPELPQLDRDNYAIAVASEARRIYKTNPGMSSDEAMSRAMEASSDKIREIVVTEKVLGSESLGGVLGRTRTEKRFEGPATAPAAATSSGMVEIPEVARKGMEYKAGKSYQFPGGRVGVFKGRDASGNLQIEWVK